MVRPQCPRQFANKRLFQSDGCPSCTSVGVIAFGSAKKPNTRSRRISLSSPGRKRCCASGFARTMGKGRDRHRRLG